MTEISYKQKNCLECQNKKIVKLELLVVGLFLSMCAVMLSAVGFYFQIHK